MAAKDDLGRAGEDRASAHLLQLGYTILDRNWRCPLGEIDIVAERGDLLAVVEVKTRRSTGFGHPFEAVDARKLRRLWRLARAWLDDHPERGRPGELRVQAIAVIGADPAHGEIEHLADLR